MKCGMAEREQHAGEHDNERDPEIADTHELYPAGGRNRRGRGAEAEERQKSNQPVDEDHGRGERFRAGVGRRVRDADDVATDVAGKKIVEERGNQEGLREMAQPDVDLLRLQQQAPSPGAGRQHRRIGEQGGGSPPPAHVCELAEKGLTIGTAQQEGEQAYTYDDLEDRERGLHAEALHKVDGIPGCAPVAGTRNSSISPSQTRLDNKPRVRGSAGPGRSPRAAGPWVVLMSQVSTHWKHRGRLGVTCTRIPG